MERIKDLKKKAFEILKKLKILTDRGDKEGYLKLKNDFQVLMPLILGPNYVKSKEHDNWDLARNQLDNIFTFKMRYDNQRMEKEDYEKYKKIFEKKFLELIEELKKEL